MDLVGRPTIFSPLGGEGRPVRAVARATARDEGESARPRVGATFTVAHWSMNLEFSGKGGIALLSQGLQERSSEAKLRVPAL